jgi:hypothetical protein
MCTQPASYVPFAVPSLDPQRLAASASTIRLLPRDNRLLVMPGTSGGKPGLLFAPFVLSVLPGALLDGLTRLVRIAERRTGLAAAALLHLDSANGEWFASFPPDQPSAAEPAVAALVREMQSTNPSLLIDPARRAGLLLAGGYFATPSDHPDVLAKQIPPADGLWLFHRAGRWAQVDAFVRALGKIYSLSTLDAAADLETSGEIHPGDRTWILSPA